MAINVNGSTTPKLTLTLGSVVQLFSTGAAGTYAWTLLDKPPGSVAALSDIAVRDPAVTVDLRGSYRVRLVLDGDPVAANWLYATFAVQEVTLRRIPAKDEGGEAGGWHTAMRSYLRRLDEIDVAGGTIVAKMGAAGLVYGRVLRVDGFVTVDGLTIPVVVAVNTASPIDVDQTLFVFEEMLDGGAVSVLDEFGFVRARGLMGPLHVAQVGLPLPLPTEAEILAQQLDAPTFLRASGLLADNVPGFTPPAAGYRQVGSCVDVSAIVIAPGGDPTAVSFDLEVFFDGSVAGLIRQAAGLSFVAIDDGDPDPNKLSPIAAAGKTTLRVGITDPGNVYELRVNHNAGGDKVVRLSGDVITDAEHGNRAGGALHAVATGAVAGFESAADKAKLDAMPAGALVMATDGSRSFSAAVSGVAATASGHLVTKAQLDALAAGLTMKQSVLDRDLSDPPGAPSVGDRYIVKAVGINGWAGQDNNIAEWSGSAWVFDAKAEGDLVYLVDENIFVLWDGAAYVSFDPLAALVAGDGLSKTGSTLNVGAGSGVIANANDVAVDHATAAPPAIAVAGAVGAATKSAREDHTHAHGNQTDGALHAVATGAVAGFMAASDKTKLDGVATGATKTYESFDVSKAIADAGAADVLPEAAWNRARASLTIAAMRLVPNGALTANDTDYASIIVRKRTAAGAATVLATITTKTAGAGGTGNWSAFASISITPDVTTMAADESLTVEMTKSGAGVVAPGWLVHLDVDF